MKIKAHKDQGFGNLVRAMTKEEQYHYPWNTRGVCEAIRAELEHLVYQNERIETDADAYLESLVRIAAIARTHAVANELAIGKGVDV